MPADISALARRTAVVCLVVLGVALLATLLILGSRLILLLFAAMLIALLLRDMSGRVAHRTGLGPRVSLTIVIVGLLGLATGASLLLAPRLVAQIEDLVRLVPQSVGQLEEWSRRIPGGEWLLTKIHEGVQGYELQRAQNVAMGVLSGLVAAVVIAVASLYFVVDPDTYVRGLTRFVPVEGRPRARELLAEIGDTLRRFLEGRLVSMVFVAPLTALGLWILDVPVPGVLGLLAGLLTFVPYAGPITAAVPILLVSATQGGPTLLWAAAMYTVVQAIEGFVITPLVQQWAVKMAPVVTIGAEVLMGTLFGPVGVIVSVPVAAAVMVLLRRLYVEDALECDTPPDHDDDSEPVPPALVESDEGHVGATTRA